MVADRALAPGQAAIGDGGGVAVELADRQIGEGRAALLFQIPDIGRLEVRRFEHHPVELGKLGQRRPLGVPERHAGRPAGSPCGSAGTKRQRQAGKPGERAFDGSKGVTAGRQTQHGDSFLAEPHAQPTRQGRYRPKRQVGSMDAVSDGNVESLTVRARPKQPQAINVNLMTKYANC